MSMQRMLPVGKSRIAFISHLDDQNITPWLASLFVMSADGSELQRVFPDLSDPSSVAYLPPAWSPDGARLAFVVSERGSYSEPTKFLIYTTRSGGTDASVLYP